MNPIRPDCDAVSHVTCFVGLPRKPGPTRKPGRTLGPWLALRPKAGLLSEPYRAQRNDSQFGARFGFSLLEIIIATAILAGSGLAIHTLIGQGSQWARKAEQQTMALHLAQTLLDETLAIPGVQDGEMHGQFQSDSEWAYRLALDPPNEYGLVHVVVDVFPANESGHSGTRGSTRPTCRLQRWIRQSLIVLPEAAQPYLRTSNAAP